MDYKILIVDDEPDIVSMLASFFAGNGYQVLTAHSGMESLRRVEQNPDIILLDINMPDMDGLETFERMKEFHNEAPVIFLTASGDEDDVMSAIRLGAVNYLKKPFYPQDLLQRIAKELDKK